MPISTLKAIGTLTDNPEGKRLLDAAQRIMADQGHGALDPIHVIMAAVADDYAPTRVKQLFVRFNIHRGIVMEAMRHVRPSEHMGTEGQDGQRVEFINVDAKAMFDKLAGRREAYLTHRSSNPLADADEWSWYATLVLLALESEGPSMEVLASRVG